MTRSSSAILVSFDGTVTIAGAHAALVTADELLDDFVLERHIVILCAHPQTLPGDPVDGLSYHRLGILRGPVRGVDSRKQTNDVDCPVFIRGGLARRQPRSSARVLAYER